MSIVEKKERKKRINKSGFITYVVRVLKQVHPDARITKKAGIQMSEFMILVAKFMAKHSREAILGKERVTITSREIQNATRSFLPGELAKHAVSEGTKAVTKYNDYLGEKDDRQAVKKMAFGKIKGAKGKKSVQKHHRAGLTFSSARCRKYLKDSKIRVGEGAPIYLAAVLEYLCAEILELAGNVSRDNKAVTVTVTVRHIFLAISGDEELALLMKILNVEFCGSGVRPFIHPELLPSDEKKQQLKRKAPKKEKGDNDAPKPHKFHPGTVAIRTIRKQQKSTLLLLQKAPFERNVRSLSREFQDDVRFSDGVILTLQYFVEARMIQLFADAQKLAIFAGRDGVTKKDVVYACEKLNVRIITQRYNFQDYKKKNKNNIVRERANFSEPSLKRLARRAGVKRISKDVYSEMNDIAASIIGNVLQHLISGTEFIRAKTVFLKVLKSTLSNLGYNFIF
jgi:histone H2A